MTPKSQKKVRILFGVLTALVVGVVYMPRFAQNPAYHNFADQREIVGIPHFFDVISNLVFLAAAVFGFLKWKTAEEKAPEREFSLAYLGFLVGLAWTAFGSAYYHWAPTTETLVWDRLPMTVAFMSFLAMMVFFRISKRAARKIFWPLIILGFLSVFYWATTESHGAGDLRPYFLVQFGMILTSILIFVLFKAEVPSTAAYMGVIFSYALAKLTETFDQQIWSATNEVISGHPLKHLLAGIGCWYFIKHFRKPL